MPPEDFIPLRKEGDQAEFNNAVANLERMDQMQYHIEFALINSNCPRALMWLESFENELDFCFKDQDKKDITAIKKEINEMYAQFPRMGNISIDVYGNKSIIFLKENTTTRSLIIKYNKILRVIKNREGMTMPKKGEGGLF